MKPQFKKRKLLKIYIEQSQFDQLKAAASLKCLSIGEFIRRQLVGLHESRFNAVLDSADRTGSGKAAARRQRNASERRDDGLPGAAAEHSMEVLQAVRVQRRDAESACSHHKRKGDLCYKCDPKFGLPSLNAE